MKRFNLSFLILTILLLSIFSACKKEEVLTFNKILTQNGGNWNMTYLKSEEFENDTTIFEFELSGGVVGTYTFNEDGTGSTSILGGSPDPLNWTYNEANNQVTVSDDSTTYIFDVLVNTESNQEWRSEETATSGGVTYRSVTDVKMQKP